MNAAANPTTTPTIAIAASSARVTMILLHPIDATEPHEGRAARLRWRHASRDVALCLHVEVKADLIGERALDRISAEERTDSASNPCEKRQRVHWGA